MLELDDRLFVVIPGDAHLSRLVMARPSQPVHMWTQSAFWAMSPNVCTLIVGRLLGRAVRDIGMLSPAMTVVRCDSGHRSRVRESLFARGRAVS